MRPGADLPHLGNRALSWEKGVRGHLPSYPESADEDGTHEASPPRERSGLGWLESRDAF